MSILLPEIDEIVASTRLHSLQLSLKELEICLAELSAQRSLLHDKRTDIQHSPNLSPRRRSLLAFQLTSRRDRRCDAQPMSIDKELQCIEARITNLLQRHRRLSFSLEIYREILAPISRIPYELLQQIFLHSLPSGFATPSLRKAPLLLTTVCRKWRSIALSTPLLWSSISTTSDWPLRTFQPQTSTPSCTNKFTRLLVRRRRPYSTPPSQPLLWIERAGNTPFHMEITIPKKDYWFGTTDPYFHWVMLTSERWFHLRLTARSINLALLLSKPMPKLKNLELVGIYDRNYDIFMFRTHRAEFDLYPERYSFPWLSLTTLEARDTWFIVDQLITILKGSPNLKSCTAKIQDLYTIHQLSYRVKFQITHSSLTLLRVSTNDREAYALRRFLDSLSLTSLTTLQVSTLRETTRSDWPHLAFIAFIRRSECPLQELHLRGFSMFSRTDTRWSDARQMTEIWTCLPLLETFEFL